MGISIICSECGATAQPLDWRCTSCDGVLDFEELPAFSQDHINSQEHSLWRYRDWLPVGQKITLGEGMTPLVEATINGQELLLKLEYLNPTGSYKDRGTTTMMNYLAGFDVDEVIDDSSGNAGSSVAAYASALGIPARIFVPADGSEPKKALIRAFGAQLEEVPGAAHIKTEACHQAAASTTYASHAWSPFFLLGQMTAGLELWEQTYPNVPDAVITPLGHGALFLGIARGFQLLKKSGLVEKVPQMFGVQSEYIDPVVQGFESGAEVPPRVIESQRTIADGVMVDRPVRGKEVLRTIRETNGAALRVSDADIAQAQETLARRGFIVEPTSATTLAALPQVLERIGAGKRIVCGLTGNGLKNVGR